MSIPLFAQLPAVDLTIVIIYIAGTTLMGAWFAGRQKDTTSYFVGDRNVSWGLVLASIVATETSAVTFLSVPGVGFNPRGGDYTFLQLSFGYILGRFFISWLLLPQYLHGELLTAYQLLRQRFNVAVQRVASGIFLVMRTVADGLRLYLAGLLLEQFTGWDMVASIFILGAATMIYTYLGGMHAVIWTDLIQFVIYITGALLAVGFILSLVNGGLDGFLAAGHAAGKFRLIDLSFDLTRRYTLWTGLIGGAFLTMASHGADQMMVQRYLCSRTLRGARLALLTSGFVVLAQFFLFLSIGVGLFVLHQQGTLVLPEAQAGNNDVVFGFFIVNFLPTGLVGILIAAVLAASMASLSSSLNSASSAFVNDFYRPLRHDRTEAHYLRVARFMTVALGCVKVGVALAATVIVSDRSIVDRVLSVAGFTTGMILGLFFLGSLRHPVRPNAALAGLVAGFLCVLTIFLATPIAWPWYAPVGTLVTFGVALALDRVGRS